MGMFWGERPEDRVVAFRLEGIDRETALHALEDCGFQVTSVWKPE